MTVTAGGEGAGWLVFPVSVAARRYVNSARGQAWSIGVQLVRQAGNEGTRRAGDLPVAKFLNAGEREGPSVQTKYAAVTHFERWAADQETRK